MEDNIIKFDNNRKEKIVTNELKIAKNVFIIRNCMISLKNISRISIMKMYKPAYNMKMMIIMLIGAMFFIIGFFKSIVMASLESLVLILLGLVLMGIEVWSLYYTYKDDANWTNYIVLELNSGKSMQVLCNEHSFAVEVVNVIINCINTGQEVLINMNECKIEKCQFGDNNLMMEN